MNGLHSGFTCTSGHTLIKAPFTTRSQLDYSRRELIGLGEHHIDGDSEVFGAHQKAGDLQGIGLGLLEGSHHHPGHIGNGRTGKKVGAGVRQ